MSLDRERLEEWLEQVALKYTAAELVEVLEDLGFVGVWEVISAFEEQLIEAKEKLEV